MDPKGNPNSSIEQLRKQRKLEPRVLCHPKEFPILQLTGNISFSFNSSPEIWKTSQYFLSIKVSKNIPISITVKSKEERRLFFLSSYPEKMHFLQAHIDFAKAREPKLELARSFANEIFHQKRFFLKLDLLFQFFIHPSRI